MQSIGLALFLWAAPTLWGQREERGAPPSSDTTSSNAGGVTLRVAPASHAFWLGTAAALVGGGTLDRTIRGYVSVHHTATLDRFAAAVGPFGTAHVLVPALVVSYGVAQLNHAPHTVAAIVRAGAAYAVADGIEGLLKPVVGRARPHVTGDPWDFHPFTTSGDWHSFPSAHATHIASLAAAVAEESPQPWVAVVGYGMVALVDIQRVYTDQHWTSDVVAGTALGIVASTTTVRWLKARAALRHHASPQPPPR